MQGEAYFQLPGAREATGSHIIAEFLHYHNHEIASQLGGEGRDLIQLQNFPFVYCMSFHYTKYYASFLSYTETKALPFGGGKTVGSSAPPSVPLRFHFATGIRKIQRKKMLFLAVSRDSVIQPDLSIVVTTDPGIQSALFRIQRAIYSWVQSKLSVIQPLL